MDTAEPPRLMDVLRRVIAVIVGVVAVAAAALVVWGMATGTSREFLKGTISLAWVILVQALGALTLLALAVVMALCVKAFRGRKAPLARWTLIALLLWCVWAFCRIGEYAS